MARWSGTGKATCESCKSIDVRRWYRLGRLSAGQRFSWFWTLNGEPNGNIGVTSGADAVELSYRVQCHGADWKDVNQRIPLAWTACRYGGRRPWFVCAVYANGRYCGRRVVKLFAGGELFACRHCYQLAYASQQEGPQTRGISQAQKIRTRLGGSGDLSEPFPAKPKGMHWTTYERLEARADAAEAASDLALLEWLMRRGRRLRSR
jgi:hypothetical protein